MAKKQIATFLAPSKSLVIAGEHCYAFSGSISTSAGNYTTALDFTTGKEVIDAHLELYVNDATTIWHNDAYGFKIEINGAVVCWLELDDRSEPRSRQPHNDINFIIPPLSHVLVTLYAESNETDLGTFMLKGRVYA